MSDSNQVTQHHQMPENVENPQRLDVVISTTTSRLWIALGALVALILGAFVWSIVATVPLEVTATGVVFDQSGRTAVVSPSEGIVSFSVARGAEVSAGAAIATISGFGSPSSDSTANAMFEVTSPVAGTVETISVLEGSGVFTGDQLVVIDAAQPSTQVVAFVSAADAALFEVGDAVKLSEAVTDRSSPSFYLGKVESTSSVPVTYESVLLAFQSEALAQQIITAAGSGAYQVVISLAADGQGSLPPQGQVLDITYRYSEVRPIRLLFGGDIE